MPCIFFAAQDALKNLPEKIHGKQWSGLLFAPTRTHTLSHTDLRSIKFDSNQSIQHEIAGILNISCCVYLEFYNQNA